MKKTLYLISNAHIDPVWQWEWDEGAAAAVSTFRVAAKFCRQRDNYIFCHNEAALYEWIAEYEPSLFEEIKSLVKAGKWVITGGWYIQPDCNMPSGESFVRQATYGRRYFMENFGVKPVVCNNYDSFGHSRGLVQILQKCGYKYYLHCRPGDGNIKMPDTYKWVGYDGSSVIGQRQQSGYGTALHGAAGKARSICASIPDNGSGICLWGVGDHGGGASEYDLDELDKFIAEAKNEGVTVKHASPEEYFESLDKDALPVWDKSINPWAVGCYTSQAQLKTMYRALEDMYYQTEKTAAASEALVPYPYEKLRGAMKTLLFAAFHDYLPGSSVEPVEAMGIRQLGGAYDELTKIRTACIFAACAGQKPAEPDEIPVIVYNPHPYPVKGVFECEFMLWDQGWGELVKMPKLTDEYGRSVPVQCEKELSNIPIDWRKRISFEATVAPTSVSRFCCRFDDVPKRAPLHFDGETFCFDNGRMSAMLDLHTGYLTSYKVGGSELLGVPSPRLDVIADNCDPWGMTVTSYRNKIGSFELLDAEEGSSYCALPSVVPSVRLIEDGDVRTVIEAVFGYKDSRAVMTYRFPKNSEYIDVTVRLEMHEKQKMIKFCITSPEKPQITAQTPYGREPLDNTGEETVSQRYKIINEGENSLLLSCRSTYGASVENNDFCVSLLRTAAYTAHPLGDRQILPDDRYTAHMDTSMRIFEFRLTGGETEYISDHAERITQAFCEAPYCMSFFPSGEGVRPEIPLKIEGDDCVVMTAFKRGEYKGKIIRLFNPTDTDRTVSAVTPDLRFTVTVPARQFVTYMINGDEVYEISADETEIIGKIK